MESLLCLKDLAVGECAMVWKLKNRVELRRRLRDMGLVEGTCVKCIGKSPAGDPAAYLVRGTVIAIRKYDARQIIVTPPTSKELLPWD